MTRVIIALVVAMLSVEAGASTTRTIDADSITSSDHSKTFTFPSTSGALLASGSLPVASQMQQEIPSGTVNGSNASFTLAFTPVTTASLQLYLDGVLLLQTTDYTLSGATITFASAPATGQSIRAIYSKF